jgi:hypothetical protein
MNYSLTPATIATLRRVLRIPSPMNVWKKTFTSFGLFEELHSQFYRDYEFFCGNERPVGTVINIRTPQEFIVNRIGNSWDVN